MSPCPWDPCRVLPLEEGLPQGEAGVGSAAMRVVGRLGLGSGLSLFAHSRLPSLILWEEGCSHLMDHMAPGGDGPGQGGHFHLSFPCSLKQLTKPTVAIFCHWGS